MDLQTRKNLEHLAEQFDCTWGDKPNICRLLRKIATGDIVLQEQNRLGYLQKKQNLRGRINEIQILLTEIDNNLT